MSLVMTSRGSAGGQNYIDNLRASSTIIAAWVEDGKGRISRIHIITCQPETTAEARR
jgi:hypothetical protein